MSNGNRPKYDVVDGRKPSGKPKTAFIDPDGKGTPKAWCYLCEFAHAYGMPCMARKW